MGTSPHAQLGGWKAIAAYLQRDERTVMRWAAQRGMPVQRVPGEGRASVYASPEALDAWLRSGERGVPTAVEDAPSAPPDERAASRRPIPWWWFAGAAAIVLVAAAMLLLPRQRVERSPAEPPVFTDPATRALYLKATFDWNLRTRDSLLRATREYSEAIGHDPRVAGSYVGLANSYLLLREYGSLSDDQAYPRAEAAARAALALAPSTAAMHRVLAFLAFWWHGDRDAAAREFAQALALAPDDALTHHWFANALSANGEHRAALREINLARDLDPTSSSLISDAGLLTYLGGDRREGRAMLEAQAREQPQDVSVRRALADIALFEGRAGDFLVQSRAMRRLQGDGAGERDVARLAEAERAGGLARLTNTMLAEARDQAGHSPSGYFRLARVASLVSDGTEATSALARACRDGEPAAIGAHGDLWLSRSLSLERIRQLCAYRTLLS